jgi:hypothetical protein
VRNALTDWRRNIPVDATRDQIYAATSVQKWGAEHDNTELTWRVAWSMQRTAHPVPSPAPAPAPAPEASPAVATAHAKEVKRLLHEIVQLRKNNLTLKERASTTFDEESYYNYYNVDFDYY